MKFSWIKNESLQKACTLRSEIVSKLVKLSEMGSGGGGIRILSLCPHCCPWSEPWICFRLFYVTSCTSNESWFYYSQISQYFPVNHGLHEQLNLGPLTSQVSWHVPPLLHGFRLWQHPFWHWPQGAPTCNKANTVKRSLLVKISRDCVVFIYFPFCKPRRHLFVAEAWISRSVFFI